MAPFIRPEQEVQELDKIMTIERINEKDGWTGFEISTKRSKIGLLISTDRCCCEKWGTGISSVEFNIDLENDNNIKEDFAAPLIGAIVNRVKWAPQSWTLNEYGDLENAMVEIQTNRGVVNLEAWNVHDGYYPHDVKAYWAGYEETQAM